MEVKINLNNPLTTDKVNVDLQWNIEVTDPKPGFLAKIFRKHNRVNRQLKISVTDIRVPNDIVCDSNNLFSILYREQIFPQSCFPVDVELTDMSTPYQILFHQGEIKDCKRPQDANPRSYPIKFKVVLQDIDGEIVNSVNEQIDVIFEPLGVKPNFRIDLNEDEIQYSSSLKLEKVGTFAAWLDEEFQYAPDQLANVSLKLYRGTQELSNQIFFDNHTNFKDIVITRGRANVVKEPIFIDFTNISNPTADEEDYTIESKIVLSASYSPEVRESLLRQVHFKLKKDQQGTELKVYIKMPDSDPTLCESDRSVPSIPMSFVPRSRLMGQANVILSNIATDNTNPHAGLYIKNLTLTESIAGDVKVIGEDNSILNNFVKIEGRDVDAMNSSDGLFIPNGIDAKTTINIFFNPSGIVDLLNSNTYDFKVNSVLTFDYWEDQHGLGILSDSARKQGKVPLVWNLHLEPNPEWLCVDYGSSAIVCRYNDEIINLKRQKDAIFRTAENGKFHKDSLESNTQFLSSDIVLHTVRDRNESTLCSQQSQNADIPYLNLSVCLSPTSSLITNDVRTQLPCLKILVGNEFLPPKRDFLSFQYTRRDEDGRLATIEAKDAMRNNEESCILRISSIFNEAYAALFRYFILPVCRDKSINKLVLTYPNTYTPAHIKVLERIAKDTFPKVRSGYLRFVSESDAVAAYYLQNWDSFNKNSQISDEETVLVYDMGAGTLDLTLFRKALNNNGKIEVRILGKIGTGKAGNYLDYLIGEIIDEKVIGAIKAPSTISTKSQADVMVLNERLKIKDCVKNKIKPNLKPETTLSCGDVPFDSNVILNDNRFTEFLDQITTGIIKQLIEFVNDTNLKIDTVLMSGRSCRLSPLQKALKNALSQTGNSGARVIKFKSDGDKEKTVVVEGAMARAGIFSSPESPVVIMSKRLYASYGLIYKRLGGSWHYTELLRCSNLPFVSDNSNLVDFEGPNVLIEGTASSDSIKLIQTYLSPEDTEKAYNSKDFEFISEMEVYDMADFGGKDQLNVKLRLDYKNNISLYVNGRNSIGSSPKGVDLTSEITKRSIWPVTI